MDSYDYNAHPHTAAVNRPLYRGTQLIWYLLSILEVILFLRLLLRLLAANPGAAFTRFMYSLSYPFVRPFLAVFPATRVEGSVLEWATILAMFVYWLIALAIFRLLVMGRPVSNPEAHEQLRQQDQ